MKNHRIESILKNTRLFFKNRKMRYTPQREQIIREIFREDVHFDVESLLARLATSRMQASRATLYRTINILIELKYLKPIQHNLNKKFFEHILDHEHHDHVICLTCGRIHEFMSKDIEKIQRRICRELEFEIRDHIHEIYGICSRCLNSHDVEKLP